MKIGKTPFTAQPMKKIAPSTKGEPVKYIAASGPMTERNGRTTITGLRPMRSDKPEMTML
mgnify:CR=1 FL=1